MNKEQVYDEKIDPLMAQIIAICQEHKIAMLATFDIPPTPGDDLCCTSHLPDESGNLPARIAAAARAASGPSPLMLTTRNAAGEVTTMTAIVP
jgi:hypothetical protein